MSDAEAQDQQKSKDGSFRQRVDGKPRARGGTVTKNRGGMYQPVRDNAARAAARAMYEGTPGATCAKVAAESGIPEGTIRRWKAEDGWKSAARTIPDLAGRAGQLADTFRTKMSELGKPLSDDVAAAEAAKELSTQHAVNIRAGVLDRHRKEWSVPRKLAYDAVQTARTDLAKGFEMSKLAKITAETLQIVQNGECRAFGLDANARAGGAGTVVVIDRGGPDDDASGVGGDLQQLEGPQPTNGGEF